MREAKDQNEAKLYEIFDEIGITEFEVHEHPAVYNMAEIDELNLDFGDLNLKNLLIREKKTGRYFLVIIDGDRRMDMKHFKEVTGWKQTCFADDEELMTLTGMIPGSVTPLALFNDTEKKIIVVLGNEITNASDDTIVDFHPCRNTATLTMKKADFVKFLEHIGNEIIFEQ